MGALLCTSHLGLPAAARAQETPEADEKRSDITVTAWQVDVTPTASKADIPALENAQAISIVSQQTLRDRGVLRLGDALSGVGGVSRNNIYGFFDGFNIRRFTASSGATYLDGLLDDTGYGTSEMTGLERVEVVKGPASGIEVDLPLIAYWPDTPQPDAGIMPDITMSARTADIQAERDTALMRAIVVVS